MQASNLADMIKKLNAEKEAMFQRAIDALIVKISTQLTEFYEEGDMWTQIADAKHGVISVDRISENYQVIEVDVKHNCHFLPEGCIVESYLGVPFREYMKANRINEIPIISGIRADKTFDKFCEMLEKNGFGCYIGEKSPTLKLLFSIS